MVVLIPLKLSMEDRLCLHSEENENFCCKVSSFGLEKTNFTSYGGRDPMLVLNHLIRDFITLYCTISLRNLALIDRYDLIH